jgi:hypothetical protein
MAKSVLGSQVLWDKGHFNDFSDFIRQHGMEEDDVEIIGRLKSMLWAVVRANPVSEVYYCNLTRTSGSHRGC